MQSLQENTCGHVRDCPIAHVACPGECLFADVMQSANLGIIVVDKAQRRVLFQNKDATHLTSRADYAQIADWFHVESEEDTERLAEQVWIGSRLVGFSIYGHGTIRWMFCRDITEKQRLEALAEAMEQANSFAFVFSSVRHELGNPVNSIKTALTVLKMNLTRGNGDSAVDYVDRCLKELGRVEDLLRTLKNFSMFEDVRPKPVRLFEVLESFALLARPDLARRGTSLTLEPVPHDLWVHADARGLQHVLLNLLANAVDATDGQQDARICIGVRDLGPDLVQIHFEDNGPGMDPPALDHLFKPFYTTKAGGTGLGLVICRKTLARMGGTITAESAKGRGTTLIITLGR